MESPVAPSGCIYTFFYKVKLQQDKFLKYIFYNICTTNPTRRVIDFPFDFTVTISHAFTYSSARAPSYRGRHYLRLFSPSLLLCFFFKYIFITKSYKYFISLRLNRGKNCKKSQSLWNDKKSSNHLIFLSVRPLARTSVRSLACPSVNLYWNNVTIFL